MMQREPPEPQALQKPVTIHLTAVYQSAGALLRELSRAVNRGATKLRSESGLPVGTLFTLGLVTEALPDPIVVSGVVTSTQRKGSSFEMLLRYDFDPARSRQLLDSVLTLVQGEQSRGPESRKPPREPRVPLALGVENGGLRGVKSAVENLSQSGCRLEMRGARLPALAVGDRLKMTLHGSNHGERRRVVLGLEVRWVRKARGKGGLRLTVGAAFAGLTAQARARLLTILKLRDLRPTIRLQRAPARRRPSRTRPRRRSA
jgi:hypothetical protein